MLAANDVFYVSALIFLLLIPLVFLTRPHACGGRVGRMRRRGRTGAPNPEPCRLWPQPVSPPAPKSRYR